MARTTAYTQTGNGTVVINNGSQIFTKSDITAMNAITNMKDADHCIVQTGASGYRETYIYDLATTTWLLESVDYAPVSASVTGATQRFTATQNYPANVQITLTLENYVADTQVTVYSGTEISVDNIDTISGTNTVKFTPPFDIEPGEEIEVLYHRTIGAAAGLDIQLDTGGITGTVNALGEIVITYNIINNASVPKDVQLDMLVTDGGSNSQTKQATYTAPVGSSSVSYTFPGLPSGTYTFTSTGELPGTVTPLVIPAKAPVFVYSNFRTVQTGKNVVAYADVANTGNDSGSTHVHFYKGTTENIVNTPVILPGGSTTVSMSYPNLADGTYTFKAYEDDNTTQIGSNSVIVVSTSAPVSLEIAQVKCFYAYFGTSFLNTPSYGFPYPPDNNLMWGNVWKYINTSKYDYRSWGYANTASVGTVITAKLVITNITVNSNIVISESALSTPGTNPQTLWNDVSGTVYYDGAITNSGTTAKVTLNAAAVAKINQKNGFYFNLRGKTYDLDSSNPTRLACYLELTY